MDEFLRRLLADAIGERNAFEATERGLALLSDYERFARPSDLFEAVGLFREAFRELPEYHPDRVEIIGNLATGSLRVFERTGDMSVLMDGVAAARLAVAVGSRHPEYAGHLSNLGILLHTVAEQTGETAALAEAVELLRRAVAAAAPDHPERRSYLSNLCGALQMLYDQTGEAAVLAEAVEAGRRAVAAAVAGDPTTGSDLSNLGLALAKLFQRSGDAAVLAEAVETGRRAVAATPPQGPARAGYLSNLCAALRMLFRQTGDAAALAEAVQTGRLAVAATAPEDPDRCANLTNLGAALRASFDRTRDVAVLREAVETNRLAVAATAQGDWRRPVHLNNLGSALFTLSEETGDIAVLDEATEVAYQTVEAAAADDDPFRARYLSNLCSHLRSLFEHCGESAVLGEAVRVGREAVAAAAPDDPDRALYLVNLGGALQTLYTETPAEDTVLDEAMDCFRSAASLTIATPDTRVGALRSLTILLGARPGGTKEALDAMEAAVVLLPQISPRTLARGDREHQIGRLGSVAHLAAGAALSAGRPGRAVELLEAARGTLVADVIDARSSDLARLRDEAPDLAREFEALRVHREQLDAWPTSAVQPEAGGPGRGDGHSRTGRDLARDRQLAQAEWDDLVGRIRAVEGFSGFLAAPGVGELAAQAGPGPIVFLTAGPARCDALILTGDTADPVRTVRLDRLTQQDAIARADQLRNAQRSASARDLAPAAGPTGQREILDVLAWLWDTVTEPVLTALGYTTTPGQSDQWPRVWWCPVGVLALLPLHAAGHHPDPDLDLDLDPPGETAPRTVLDRVVSSYTPTVRALAYARSHPPTTANATLLVAVPDAPGTTPLPGVPAEADAITALIPTALRPDHPIRADVLAALPSHPVAHFCCHGYADWDDPASSRLVLYDHRTDPLTVADINALHLTGALAYLSACETSSTRPRLADEALHLTGAFHLAGYQNVIGTHWPVHDTTATRIATDFYTHLTQRGTTPDTTTSAHALHHAIRTLRTEHPTEPTHWAAHTHTGT